MTRSERRTVDAVYHDGLLIPVDGLDLPERARVRVSVEAPTSVARDGDAPGTPWTRFIRVVPAWLGRAGSVDGTVAGNGAADTGPTAAPVVDAIYRDGVLCPLAALDLPVNSRVRVSVAAEGWPAPRSAPAFGLGAASSGSDACRRRLAAVLTAEWALFGLALTVYAVTRLWGLDRFPIYFFVDEAIQALQGEELAARFLGWLRPGLPAVPDSGVPLFFSHYVYALPTALFGKSIFVTRATNVAVSVLGAAAVALILKWVFRARFWWAGALILAAIPAWFLHSRTAFEYVTMGSFYACFLLFYLLYRCRSPRYLVLAVPFGAATFYTYGPGQVLMVATGLLLLLSDLRYHLRQRAAVLIGLVLISVVAAPKVAEHIRNPVATTGYLRELGSYWFEPIPVEVKLGRFGDRYLQGLDPRYWFFPHQRDLERHRMEGYGHIRTELLPLALLGVGLCLWRIKSSPHRAILLAALATPIGTALVGLTVGRALAFVVPAAVLVGLGLECLLARLPRRVPRAALAGGVFAILSLASGSMLHDALTRGPTWFRDYGLFGMQYGAKILFEGAVPGYLERHPDARLVVSPNWANRTSVLLRYFLSPPERERVRLDTVEAFLSERRELTDRTTFVMLPDEYELARGSPKLKSVDVEQVLPYPDGRPGFYFARIAYADTLDEILAAERAERLRLVEAQLEIDGETVDVRHSRLDIGQPRDMFDGNRGSLARGLEANPFVVELLLPGPRPLSGLALDLGSMELGLTVTLSSEGTDEAVTYTRSYRNLPRDPHVELAFDRGPERTARVRVEISDLAAGESAHVHVREVRLHGPRT